MADYYTLLELEIEEPDLGGIPHRLGFSTYHGGIEVEDQVGDVHYFGPGLLEMQLPSRSADLYSGAGVDSGGASASLALSECNADVLLRAGVRLQRIRCRIWWWRVGDMLEAATQVWRGQIADPRISEDRNLFDFTIATGTREQDAAMPPGQLGDEGRFPLAPEQARAAARTVIYGGVNALPVFRVSSDPGPSPPAAATDVRFFVCGHETMTFLPRLTDGQDVLSGILTPELGVDGLGDRYTYVDVPNATAGWTEGATYHLTAAFGWKGPGDPSAPQPGFNNNAIDRLGDVLIHIVTTYAKERFFELDRERIFGARALLNRFRVGMIFNEPQGGSVLRFLKNRFERQFPVTFSFAAGRFGWDYAGIPPGRHPVGQIVYGQNAFSRGDLTPVSTSVLRSRFDVQYGLDTYAAGTTESIRRDETNDAKCKGAFTRWGTSVVQQLQVPDVTDADTARLIIEDQINRLTKRRIRTSYTCEEPTWVGLPLFSRLAVTDDDRGWSDEPCLVEGISAIEPGRVQVSLITEEGL